ncbi:SphA family protein [Enterovirga rhinocerotis]|uniref:Outer membrane beta-barrel porin/alpha-amylase n=1 Tax=Enterovirga rhinocerotis TaxID=1339210 RepID=A0A4R7BMG8_9HYPH|nr:transporter [Enterovirga rhinocerotis]TDR85117.1 hypothetical protein EV668_4658 [Enterovirga rhinocerotis]
MTRSAKIIATILLALPTLSAVPAAATEGGGSLYVPGIHGPMAGFVPPPAFYLANNVFYYSGDFSAGRRTQIGGALVADVKANIALNFITPTWITPVEVFGGNLGFAVSVPFGSPRVQAGALIAAPRLGRTAAFQADDNVFNVGDPVVSSLIGWHAGNLHWSLTGSVSIPSGSYRDGALSNVSFNRPIGDLTAAVTWLDPSLGLDVSGAVGFEVNGRNAATDYRSGNAVHFDLAITKSLTKELSLGVIAGHYEQVSADRGSPLLGQFKGRTTAVGGTLNYSFKIGETPVSTGIRILREVEVRNRPQGTMGFLTISFPLGGPLAPAAASGRAVAAAY